VQSPRFHVHVAAWELMERQEGAETHKTKLSAPLHPTVLPEVAEAFGRASWLLQRRCRVFVSPRFRPCIGKVVSSCSRRGKRNSVMRIRESTFYCHVIPKEQTGSVARVDVHAFLMNYPEQMRWLYLFVLQGDGKVLI